MGWTVLSRGNRRKSRAEEPGRTTRQEPKMPIVTIQQGPRDVEQKRELVKKVTEAFVEALEVPAESVFVWIQEYQPENWGAAGKLTADR
ncbi:MULTISPECIES: 4-oxalocrotonate tautomerase DmpI [Kitasatospora]|uniref:4-oxalocrotonate tautomerase family protein n=1 Tax=Kitasatospora cathayae TaxID=3004092 RepID=A0ABY7QFL3_9ACTN|nr:4-oxalocrotonate tautomerase DmpI [Kitasatospora sp. HUAS 3-15]WBP91575.1 4-oxalocrotonate tautomerase family protein [Kitasatospora sp. HUAS 3-15]